MTNECEDLRCTRRRALAVAGIAAVGLARPTMAFAQGEPTGDLLVLVTLSGGADGMTLVPPLHDPGYVAARPDVAVRASQALPLDRFFGLHPALAALMPFWHSGELAVAHAVGDSDGTRSHFAATDAMERGVNGTTNVGTGWVDRHLVARGLTSFPALAMGSRVPGTLAGAAPALATWDVRDVRLRAPDEAITHAALDAMYDGLSGPVAASGRTTLSAISSYARFRKVDLTAPSAYPATTFGTQLREVALVAKARMGLQVACVSVGGWDTHEGMGGASGGVMHDLVSGFGTALAAFAHDLGPLLRSTTIVTISEFGRRVAQNGSGGLDHGHGSAMLALGGGIRGGRVYGRWPGLAAAQLDDGDLRVTTDYRDVLGEIVSRRLGGSSLREVFPDHRANELGLTRRG